MIWFVPFSYTELLKTRKKKEPDLPWLCSPGDRSKGGGKVRACSKTDSGRGKRRRQQRSRRYPMPAGKMATAAVRGRSRDVLLCDSCLREKGEKGRMRLEGIFGI
ncbi:hypothetical protein L1887_04984 [Cichorium endivia]|nr:hypothetical protein L1887_04984 [Cichorium endivia]